MRLQPGGEKEKPAGAIQPRRVDPFGKAGHAGVFAEGDALDPLDGIGIEGQVEDRQDLVPGGAFMREDVLHEDGRPEGDGGDAEFLMEFPPDRGLGRLAELDRAAEGAHAFDAPGIVKDFGGQQTALAPVQTEGFQPDRLGGAPYGHPMGIGTWQSADKRGRPGSASASPNAVRTA